MHMARVPWRSITVAPCNMLHHSPPQTRKKLTYERRAPIWPTLPYCIGTEKTPYLMRSSQGLDRRSSGPNQLLRMFRGEKRPAAVPAVVGTVRYARGPWGCGQSLDFGLDRSAPPTNPNCHRRSRSERATQQRQLQHYRLPGWDSPRAPALPQSISEYRRQWQGRQGHSHTGCGRRLLLCSNPRLASLASSYSRWGRGARGFPAVSLLNSKTMFPKLYIVV